MLRLVERIALRQTRRLALSQIIALAVAVSTACAAEHLSLEAVRAHLAEQRKKVESLHLRIRRETTLSIAPEVLLSWPSRPTLPKHFGMDEVLVAFKGDQRYLRVLELDYRPPPLAGSSAQENIGRRRYLDEAKAWNGEVLLERRRNLQLGGFVYHSISAERAQECFPPPPYLRNVGLAVPDPTGKDEARRDLQQMDLLPELLKRWPYKVLKENEGIDGVPCVVLQGDFKPPVPAQETGRARRISEKLWLDPRLGFVLRQRERRVDGRLVRMVNRDFVEVFQGLWLPRESRTESWTPPDAPEQYREGPVLVLRMTLLLCIVNQVPDDVFGTALTRPRPQDVPVFDLAPAYHWREVRCAPLASDESIDEGWAVRGVGRRLENYQGSELRLLVVDTPRWHFVWSPARGRVIASPSRLGNPKGEPRTYPRERAAVIRTFEMRTGVPACEKEQVGSKQVDKVTIHFPADPRHQGWPIHDFEPRVQLTVSGTESRTRTYWFDPETDLALRRQCGCKPPKYHWCVDYPAPESVPKELFTFEVPEGARLEVVDPELRRPLYSEGKRKRE